jgi:hypothetical protein
MLCTTTTNRRRIDHRGYRCHGKITAGDGLEMHPDWSSLHPDIVGKGLPTYNGIDRGNSDIARMRGEGRNRVADDVRARPSQGPDKKSDAEASLFSSVERAVRR